MSEHKENQSNEYEQSPSAKTRRMRQNFNIYMSETSKHNPFGANSVSSTYQEKRIFKYNLMKQYIKLTTKDILLKEYEQSKYLGSMLLGLSGGYFIAVALAAVFTKGRTLTNGKPATWEIPLYASFTTVGFGYGYFVSQERYNKNVCNYILEKYLSQAVQNGFEDYQISK